MRLQTPWEQKPQLSFQYFPIKPTQHLAYNKHLIFIKEMEKGNQFLLDAESSGHRTGKGQFSFQSQRKTMPKNAQTTAQLHSFHMPNTNLLFHNSHKLAFMNL